MGKGEEVFQGKKYMKKQSFPQWKDCTAHISNDSEKTGLLSF